MLYSCILNLGKGMCGGQRTIYSSQFSTSTIEFRKFRSPGFLEDVFTLQDLSFRPTIYLFKWPFKGLVPLGPIPTIIKMGTFMQNMCHSMKRVTGHMVLLGGSQMNLNQKKTINYGMYKNM